MVTARSPPGLGAPGGLTRSRATARWIRRSRTRRETRDHDLRDRTAEQSLDRLELFRFIGGDERDSVAFAARAPRAPDTVHVVLSDVRQLEVHDLRQLVDVESPRGEVRRDEHANVPALEVGQGTRSGALTLVAVNRLGADPVLFQMSSQPIGSPLRAREDQRLVPVVRPDEKAQKLALFLAIDRVDDLRHAVRRGSLRLDLDAPRRIQEAIGKLADFARQGRREQEILTRGGELRENPADVGKKAHVEHPVRFIEDENLDAGEVRGPLPEMIAKSTRGRHDHIHAAPQRLHLRTKADASEDDGGGQRQVAAVRADAVVNLSGELARRGEDEGTNVTLLVRFAGRLAEPLQQRQRESCRLAGAGLRTGHEVTAEQNRGDGEALNGCRAFVASRVDRAKQFRRETQLVERHTNTLLLSRPTRYCRTGPDLG